MDIHIFDESCPECGHGRRPTREERVYEDALEKLIAAALVLDRDRLTVECDLEDWWPTAVVLKAKNNPDPTVLRDWWTGERWKERAS